MSITPVTDATPHAEVLLIRRIDIVPEDPRQHEEHEEWEGEREHQRDRLADEEFDFHPGQLGFSAMFARPAEYTEVPVLSLPKPASFSVETTLERA